MKGREFDRELGPDERKQLIAFVRTLWMESKSVQTGPPCC